MRFRSLALAASFAALTAPIVGCGGKAPPSDTKTDTRPTLDAPSADVGSLLYAPVPAPVYPTAVIRREPIVITQAVVQFNERQVVSAEVDGTIVAFATPVRAGERVDSEQLVYLPADTKRQFPYKRIVESDDVTDGQVVAVMDDQQVRARLEGASAVMQAAGTAKAASAEGEKIAQKRLEQTRTANRGGVGSKRDELEDELAVFRFKENAAQAEKTIAEAIRDHAEATVQLNRHQIRSRVNGVIRSIAKRPGEYVKAGEKIMEIEATDRVRIEGTLDIQYADSVRRGDTVLVEPAVSSAPWVSHTGHRQAVTGVAVAVVPHPQDGPIPLVVSVGADGAALVWDPNLGKRTDRPAVPHNLPHPPGVGVRSVAATPPGPKATLVITGGADGKIRIWDVSDRAKLPTAPKAEPEDAHGAAVHAIAVSPNGQFFASAAGRDVFIWDLASAKKKYALPPDHRDNVTSVSFTPQDTLVTASKDGTLRVWKLGTERAATIRTLDHRACAVEVLGVSREGERVLFDQDKGRIDLVDPANGQTVGQMQNVTSAGSFATLALFGPDEVAADTPADKLPPYRIATAGGDGDLKGALQYWHAPRTGGRGTEVGRLITRSPVTAAAFSPLRAEPFVVVGTAAGGVHLWKPPAESQTREAHKGKVTFIDPTDGRYVTVRVEMSNKGLNLRDRSAATIIIAPPNP